MTGNSTLATSGGPGFNSRLGPLLFAPGMLQAVRLFLQPGRVGLIVAVVDDRSVAELRLATLLRHLSGEYFKAFRGVQGPWESANGEKLGHRQRGTVPVPLRL